jgi:uncharacterized membrane protein
MSSTVNVSPQSSDQSGFRFRVRHLQFVLVFLALLVTGYMTYNKLVDQPLVCAEVGMINCAVVENSAWARVMGIPTAMLGFMAHTIILALLLLEKRVAFFAENGVLMLFGVTVFGSLYHAYLIYVSFIVLRALCPYCLAAAAIMFVQLIIMSFRLRRSLAAG